MLAEIKTAIRSRYDTKARQYGASWPSNVHDEKTEKVEKALEALAAPYYSDLVLDIGMGRRGRYVARMAEQVSKSFGIDISDVTVAVAKKHMQEKRLDKVSGVAVASADALPFPDGYFTLVVCSEVMEYYPLSDVEVLLKEIKRVLAIHGRAIVDFPDYTDGRVWELKEAEERDDVRFFVYGDNEVQETISLCGFAIIGVQKADVEIQYLLQQCS